MAQMLFAVNGAGHISDFFYPVFTDFDF